MGFFSWKTNDTNESIPNAYQGTRETFTVYVHTHEGVIACETAYEGYGRFEGVSLYDIILDMNEGRMSEREKADLVSLVGALERNPGTRLELESGCILRVPELTTTKDWTWTNSMPQSCPDQGYFYANEPTPLCGACVDTIGGASAAPDAPWRHAKKGEACGAHECVNKDTAPCDKCGTDVPHTEHVGNDDEYLCPDCWKIGASKWFRDINN